MAIEISHLHPDLLSYSDVIESKKWPGPRERAAANRGNQPFHDNVATLSR